MTESKNANNEIIDLLTPKKVIAMPCINMVTMKFFSEFEKKKTFKFFFLVFSSPKICLNPHKK